MKKVLIADDEKHVCQEIKYIIENEEDVKIVKICSTGTEAIEQISRLQPDIVFLDIDMPGLNGIEIGYYLKNLRQQPYIIYITAHDKFAVEAFRVGAQGYILKPFSEEDVREQLGRALESLDSRARTKEKGEIIPKTKLPLEDNGKFRLVEQSDILLAYANDRAVYVRINGEDIMVNFLLSQLEAYFRADLFVRCHRNYIINVTKVKEVIPWFNGAYVLVMEDASRIPVSRANVRLIRKIFCL